MKKLGDRTFVLEGRTNLGLYVSDKVYLVDTGSSKKVLKGIIEEFRGMEIVVLNTHHHADHIALNSWLLKRTSCTIAAPEEEISFIYNPILEPFLLFGSSPPESLRKNFFVAEGSEVVPLPDDLPLAAVPLPGHTPGHVGYLTPDGILFSGDLYFSKEIVEKYSFPYHSDVFSLRESVEKLKGMDFDIVVPSHGKVTTDPFPDVDFMMERVIEFEKAILEILKDPSTQDGVVLSLIDLFGFKVEGGMYYLFRSFVGALLSDLERSGELIEDSGIWKKR